MKALHLIPGNLYGGVETLLVTLNRYQNECPQLQSEFGLCFKGRLQDELIAQGAIVHELGEVRFRHPWSVLRANLKLSRLLRERRYDAIVTDGAWPHVVFAPSARLMRAPLVFWAQGAPLQTHLLDKMADRV